MRLLFLVVALLSIATAKAGNSGQPDSIATSSHPTNWDNPAIAKPSKARFAWGAECGTSIDVCGSDMSSFDLNASFGVSAGRLNFAGVGAGAHVMISNSCRSYPIFVVIRSDFARTLQPLFIDIRGGVSLNYLPENISQTGPYGSASVGFRLASGEKFRSYITAGYTYFTRRNVTHDDRTLYFGRLSLITFRLGVTF